MLRIFIDDSSKIPRCQRQHLIRAARKLAKSSTQIVFLSDLKIRPPKSWQTKTDAALSLWAKFQLLMEKVPYGVTLYIHGATLFNTGLKGFDPEELSQPLMASNTGSLQDCCFFVLDHERASWREGLQVDSSEYSNIVEFDRWNPAPLPAGWSVKTPREDLKARILDCRRFADRPWYSLHSPARKLWIQELQAALAEGDLSLKDLQKDVSEGLIGPSVLYQIERGIEDLAEVPSSIAELDRSTIVPELTVSRERLKLLHSRKFKRRVLVWRFKNIYRVKGSRKTLVRGSIKLFKKFPLMLKNYISAN